MWVEGTVKNISGRAHIMALLSEKDKRDEQRFQANKEAINAALLAAEKAVAKAEAAAEKRFEGVNEFRAQLADQARTLASSEKLDLVIQRIDRMEASQNTHTGRTSGLNAAAGYVLSAIFALAAILTFFLK